MKIIYNPATIPPGHALALGNFDGFHLGHVQIINKTREIAGHKGLKTAVLTFEPHPISLFRPEIGAVRINDLRGKAELLAGAGVEICYIIKFNRYLLGNHIVTGFNFAFGNNREGNPELLHKILGANYTQVSPVEEAGSVYSSSMARMAISAGEMKMAAKLLGHNYFVSANILQGAGKGREFGFPTANLKLKSKLLRPKYGVYAVDTNFGCGVANFGVRPTVDGKTELLEVHLFNFDREIYGERMRVEFLDFIRGEKTYNNVEELKTQIGKDIESAKTLLSSLRA